MTAAVPPLPMSPDEFKSRMRWIYRVPVDVESAHVAADNLLCELLRSLGYGDGVTVFEESPKWYS
jgi:hypothetical protein